MDTEELIRTLHAAGLSLLKNAEEFGELDSEYNLNRTITFEYDGEFFSILWFKNMMTLSHNCGINVMFDHVEHSSTWPNNFKRNLQFRARGEVVAVIGLERYPDYAEEVEGSSG